MKLSVIIVNYNVKHFLYQAIDSALRALNEIDGEIIVVDNNSTDGSVEMVQNEFPRVTLIANKVNTGFATANNQGINIAKGKYCLLLNPDTIVKEDTFYKCVEFLENNPQFQGLGIKMIDGSGQFLPESKRSFPSPKVAFYKLFGLATLFPKNEQFGKYHLTYLSPNENHSVDVLSGAYLMAPTKKLKEIGGLDESFFMYGEDIDLSWRLKENGFENVYFTGSQIVHYKGESTKKGSLNYVKRFYEAMIIFAEKHFTGKKARIFIYLMRLAVYLRASITLLTTILKKITLPILEFSISYILLVAIQHIWGLLKVIHYPTILLQLNLPMYIILSLLAMHLSGSNDKPYRFAKLLRGTFSAIVFCSIAYAFLPEGLRFSRALVVFSVLTVSITVCVLRMIIQYRTTKNFSFYGSQKRKAILIGNNKSNYLANDKLFTPPFISYLGLVAVEHSEQQIASIHDLPKLLKKLKPTDILLDTEVVPYSIVVDTFELANQYQIKCHTALKKGNILISSHSKNDAGNALDFNQNYIISTSAEKRKKRLFDVVASLILLLLAPLLFFFQQSPINYLKNLFQVFFAKKTIVGYTIVEEEELPKLKPPILQIGASTQFTTNEIQYQQKKNYAKYYSIYEDFDILIKGLSHLGDK